jgi:hypothetical protein
MGCALGAIDGAHFELHLVGFFQQQADTPRAEAETSYIGDSVDDSFVVTALRMINGTQSGSHFLFSFPCS